MNNSCNPPYRMLGNTRFVQINGSWFSTAAIESIEKPGDGCVTIRTISGSSIHVEGVYSLDAFANGVLGKRYDSPMDTL